MDIVLAAVRGPFERAMGLRRPASWLRIALIVLGPTTLRVLVGEFVIGPLSVSILLRGFLDTFAVVVVFFGWQS